MQLWKSVLLLTAVPFSIVCHLLALEIITIETCGLLIPLHIAVFKVFFQVPWVVAFIVYGFQLIAFGVPCYLVYASL